MVFIKIKGLKNELNFEGFKKFDSFKMKVFNENKKNMVK